MLGSLGFLNNSIGGILFALLFMSGLAVWSQRHRKQTVIETLVKHRRHILVTELLFLIALCFWAWVRAQNPQIAYTEKPMEFAFLNAVGRTSTFPPLDPWLSGFAISYYYFGYVMMSLLTRLSAVPAAVGFNLGTAWLFAATMTGAFGLIHDLVILAGKQVKQAAGNLRLAAVTLGLVGAVAVGMAGNLEIVLEVAHANGVGSAEMWQFIDIKDINGPSEEDPTPRYQSSNWWWWRSSRLITEKNLAGTEEGIIEPIAEFPAFSFSLGDLHPHVLALPYAFLSIALALTWFLRRDSWQDGLLRFVIKSRFHFAITALVVGGLSFLNTWDVLIHLFVLIGAIGLSIWRYERRWHGGIAGNLVLIALVFIGAAYVLYLPFYIGFSSQAGAPFILPTLVRPTRLTHFLVFFGMPMLAVFSFITTLLFWQRFRKMRSGVLLALTLVGGLLLLMIVMGLLIGASPFGADRIISLTNLLGITVAPQPINGSIFAMLSWSAGAIARLLPDILSVRLQYGLVTLLLAFLIAGCVAICAHQFETLKDEARDDESNSAEISITPFVLLLILTASLLTIGPEFVYLSDQFGQRINTIFKFWYQAWVLFGIAAAVGLYILAQHARPVAIVTTIGWLALLIGSLQFPFYMVQWGQSWYGREPTLYGLAHVAETFPDEYAAINWLNQAADENDTLLEAVGGQYTDYARVSASTGLPTVLGWAGHERQWRGNSTNEPNVRTEIVDMIYQQSDWTDIPTLLDRYSVDYIYFGRLEREQYGENGIDKFRDNLEVAYQNDSVTIYAWE